jgi:hypothetical protein
MGSVRGHEVDKEDRKRKQIQRTTTTDSSRSNATCKTITKKEKQAMSKPYQTKLHRDGSVTIWNVYRQQWQRTSEPSDSVLASLSVKECERVIKHCGISNMSEVL